MGRSTKEGKWIPLMLNMNPKKLTGKHSKWYPLAHLPSLGACAIVQQKSQESADPIAIVTAYKKNRQLKRMIFRSCELTGSMGVATEVLV